MNFLFTFVATSIINNNLKQYTMHADEGPFQHKAQTVIFCLQLVPTQLRGYTVSSFMKQSTEWKQQLLRKTAKLLVTGF